MYYGTYGTYTYGATSYLKTTGAINLSGWFNQTSSLFTIPFDCYLKISVNCIMNQTSSGQVDLWVVRNGADLYQVCYHTQMTNAFASLFGFHILSCTAGQTFSLKVKAACNIYSSNCCYEML